MEGLGCAGRPDLDARVSRGERVLRGLELVQERIALVLRHSRDDRVVTGKHRAPPLLVALPSAYQTGARSPEQDPPTGGAFVKTAAAAES
jgi:hypothetical protein